MSRQITNEILQYLSPARLSPYLIQANNNNVTAYQLYCDNIKLCQDFYSILHIFEISLRNSMNGLFIQEFGNDWLCDYNEIPIIQQSELINIKQSIDKLTKRQKPITHNDIITELSFGFWSSLWNKSYDSFWIQNNRIKFVFPNLPHKSRSIKHIRNDINMIRHFRNRISHYEPIWNYKPQPSAIYTIICDYIKYISKDMYDMCLDINPP